VFHLCPVHAPYKPDTLQKDIEQLIKRVLTFATHGRTFEMRYSTIHRDSALLNGYAESRKAFAPVDDVFAELKARKVFIPRICADVINRIHC
jgi:hypothetical protein